MVYILLGTGFEEVEAIAPGDLLRRAGAQVQYVGINGPVVTGGHGIGVQADICLEQLPEQLPDMIVLPGGLGGVASIRGSQPAMELIRRCWDNGKYVAAICAGPTVLADLGITDGLHVTCYPGCQADMGPALYLEDRAAVTDGRLITGTSAGCAVPFGLELIRALLGPDAAAAVEKQIVIR